MSASPSSLGAHHPADIEAGALAPGHKSFGPVSPNHKNFVEHFRAQVLARGSATCLTVVGERGGQPWHKAVSFTALDQRARALAAVLQRAEAVGERALLVFDNDDHYAVALLACFYSGVVAVPVFPPRASQPQHLERLASIAADARARWVLTTSTHASSARQLGALLQLEVDDIDPERAGEWQPHAPDEADVAFLQYTSGSTSLPKGVMVTHASLMANQRALQRLFALGPQDCIVSWQPLYHDMGLIGGLLQPLYVGGHVVLTSPEYFLERPVRWLELISSYRAAASAGPDFAYRLCIERIRDTQLARLDLSSWRVALTGAEPVRSATVREFRQKFAAAGFAPHALRACYGLAEATLIATASPSTGASTQEFCSSALTRHVAEVRVGGTPLVSAGHVVSEHEVCIVEARTQEPLAAGHIGEIWLRGPSITSGYWAQARATADAFVVWHGQRWLRTGDLGFLHEGELYVTGRRKDLIIVRGHNLYPHDIEQAIERAVDTVRKGRVAVFAVEHRAGCEGIGIAVEVGRGEQKRSTPRALIEALSAAVSAACGEAPTVVALLDPGTLPRTSSGKLQRAACRKAWATRALGAYALFEQGRFVHGEVEAPVVVTLDATQTQLAAIWHDALHLDASCVVTGETHFFGSGGNSLSAVQVARRVADHWNVELTATTLFAHPRLAALAREIERLQAAGRRAARSCIATLPQRTGALQVSHAQERQWVLWQLDPDSSAHHVSCALRLRGELRSDELRAALHVVSLRHESLRTSFDIDADGKVRQYVQPQGACDIEVLEADAERAMQLMQQRARRAFDLRRGPLLRVTLVRVDQDVQFLALTMHHIVSDASSLQVLLTELAQRYRSLCDGTELPLATPHIQYADYAAWLRDAHAHPLSEQLAYWREQLAVVPPAQYPVLALPTDQPRTALARYRAGSHTVELPAALLRDLRRCAQAHDATLFMTLLTGFAVLLYRYTNERDLRIGVPVANRASPELAGLIGLFVNTLVLRVQVSSQMTLTQLLARVRSSALDAQAHADLPFERLVQELQPQRSLSRTALFQVMFNHLQEDLRALEPWADLGCEPVPMPDSDAQFELMLDVRERSDGTVRAVFTYASELFEHASIVRMAGHYQALLWCLASDASQPLHALHYLSACERAQLRRGLAPQRRSEAVPVHALFEAQVQAQPRAIALLTAEQSITYQCLNQWSNGLAQQLVALGVGPEVRVAVRLERTPAWVAVLLACFKAGGVYVPISTSDPVTRVSEIVRSSRARVLVTAVSELSCDNVPTLIVGGPLSGSESNLTTAMDQHTLAYLIHTSGSTGRPKAVAVEQGALSLHVQAMRAACQLTAQDRMLQFAPSHVDAALEQVLTPLIAGAALVLPTQCSSLPSELEALCARHAITVLDLPPAYVRQLLATAAVFQHAPRLVICGGEPWTWEDLALLRRVLRPQQLINAYGPTEAVITPTLSCLTGTAAADERCGSYVPIGRPVGTRHAHVLDEHLQPVPEGVPGELYLGGEHALARGYDSQPALTAERFIADPFTTNGRLYRTGDLVRWREHVVHGVQLEYLQRGDAQLKVHGFRIEPGEIEAQLRADPRVQQALVTASRDQLVAYVVAVPGEQLDGVGLRRALQESLPDYLVPALVMVLEHLPLNAAGKVDPSRLPSPAFETVARPAFAAPQSAAARMLADIWSQVLEVPAVGLYDNFFDLGGNSLLLIRAHRSLEQRGHTGVTLTELFKYPTIAALAAFLENRGTPSAAPSSVERAALKRTALQRRATKWS